MNVRRFAWTFVIAAQLVMSADMVPAQPADPYAAAEAEVKVARYKQRREVFLNLVQKLYFSVGCKVFASEAGVLPLISIERRILFRDELLIDNALDGLMRDAAKAGMGHASESGACNYWRQNPEIVADVRRAAQKAASGGF